MSVRRIPIRPMKESMDALTSIIWVSFRLHIHFYFWRKVMDFRNVVKMIVTRITSNI